MAMVETDARGREMPAAEGKLELAGPIKEHDGPNESTRSLSGESTDTIVVIIEEGPTEMGKVSFNEGAEGPTLLISELARLMIPDSRVLSLESHLLRWSSWSCLYLW